MTTALGVIAFCLIAFPSWVLLFVIVREDRRKKRPAPRPYGGPVMDPGTFISIKCPGCKVEVGQVHAEGCPQGTPGKLFELVLRMPKGGRL